jgi:RNA-directed DNA polymerase
VLRADIVSTSRRSTTRFLRGKLARVVDDPDLLWLAGVILASGAGVLDDEYRPVYFPGDDLLAACRPRGLPIGNLTSQFWSNVYLNDFDWFVQRQLGCRAYLRYVDDFALFGDDRKTLWQWKEALIARLAQERLTIHEPARRRCCRRAAASPGWASSCTRRIVCSSGATRSTSRAG